MNFLKKIISARNIESVDADKIDQLIEDKAFILDVRSKAEVEEKSIKEAVNIPLDELGARYTELPDQKIYILCRSGARSLNAARFLKVKGFEVCNIKGGIERYFASKK